MKITIDPTAVWYHGSNLALTELHVGSTVTQWRALAEAFSHKPAVLSYDDTGRILHNGVENGYLYMIDEPVLSDTDLVPHPNTSMDENVEFLTKRPLKLKRIADLPLLPADRMELWNAYNADGTLADALLVRGEPIPKGLYHLVCEVLVRHADGTFLCMQRSSQKPIYPGYYEATSGGSALPGEDPLSCIKRELYEETGIVCDAFTEVGHRVIEESQALFYWFTCTVDCNKESIILQDGETEGYRWMSEEEFIAFINSGKMIETQKQRFLPYFQKQGWITNAIGQTVTVTVDRPIGSFHPEHPDLYYPVNYGYIEGIPAPDGEEQDAYILGVNEPVEQFTGIVLAILHRRDDVEEKWVVTPANMQLTRREVFALTRFQERYFDTEIIM